MHHQGHQGLGKQSFFDQKGEMNDFFLCPPHWQSFWWFHRPSQHAWTCHGQSQQHLHQWTWHKSCHERGWEPWWMDNEGSTSVLPLSTHNQTSLGQSFSLCKVKQAKCCLLASNVNVPWPLSVAENVKILTWKGKWHFDFVHSWANRVGTIAFGFPVSFRNYVN